MGPEEKTRDDLLSQAAARQVSSALEGLTTVFGMGTGEPLRLITGNKSLDQSRSKDFNNSNKQLALLRKH